MSVLGVDMDARRICRRDICYGAGVRVDRLRYGASFEIFFQNPNGVFDMEDSWIYGSTDDAVRVTDGKINVMRNTFEKTGSNTGESLNVKSGTVGDIGYNLFIGSATNGTKISNAGATAIQCNVHCYNNTYVDCGYRSDT